MKSTALAMLLVGVSWASAYENEKYDLRGPAPKKGTSLVHEASLVLGEIDMTLSVNGQEIKLKQTMTITSEEEETYLEVRERDVVKAKTRVIKERTKTTTVLAGQESTEERKGDFEGETILSEQKDGKWKNTLTDAVPTDEQKKELDKRTGPENDDEAYPSEKVALDHKWTVDASKLKSLTGNSLSDVTGKLQQKFIRVEQVDGIDCTVVESVGVIKGKMKGDDGEKLNAELDITAYTWRSIKTGIELKGKFKGTIKFNGKIKIDGEETEMKAEGSIQANSTTRIRDTKE